MIDEHTLRREAAVYLRPSVRLHFRREAHGMVVLCTFTTTPHVSGSVIFSDRESDRAHYAADDRRQAWINLRQSFERYFSLNLPPIDGGHHDRT